MEVENKYASRGVANTALGLSIGALGVEALTGGSIGNLFGRGGTAPANSSEQGVSKYEAAQAARIAELETEVKLRDANTYTDQKMLEMYKYFDGRFNGIETQICQQSVVNAQITANIACMQNQINTLSGLTKTVIPIDSVCPEPMKRYNAWEAPTSSASTDAA